MSINPNAPGVIGVEWPVTVESASAVDSATKAIGASIISSVGESIDSAYAYASAVAGSGVYVMDVWPTATVTETPASTLTIFRPNEDVAPASNITYSTGASGFVLVDEAVLDTSDYMKIAYGGPPGSGQWYGRAAVGIGNLAGRQILRVKLHSIVKTDTGLTTTFYHQLSINSTLYTAPAVYATDQQTEIIASWDYNPNTGKPWTIADVEKFDTVDEIGFSAYATSGGLTTYIYQMWLEIEHVPEQRLGTGVATITAAGWQLFDLLTPTGVATWVKANGTEYLYTIRRLSGTGTAAFRYLDAGVALDKHAGYAPSFMDIGGALAAKGPAHTYQYAILPTLVGPTTSVDSEPYALRTLAAVYTGHTVESEFLGVAANYGVVKAIVAAQAGTPSASLTVKIKRRSDNVQMGATMTFTAAELTGTITDPRAITLRITPVALAAVQYYVEFSTTAANGSGWVVVVLDTAGSGNSATYGGTTQAATIGGVESTSQDGAVTVAQIPSPPTAPISTLLTAANGHQYVRLSWSQTGLGANFLHYEVERNDDGTWRQIAAIATESVVVFDDYEGKRGVLASYRLRVQHINTVESEYTTTVVATPQANGCLVALVSNESPSLNLAYNDSDPRQYQTRDHPVVVDLYDRDGAASFRSLELRGDEFDLQLFLGGGNPASPTYIAPAAVGRQAFQPLLNLARAQLSYVCVLDSDGNRWFAVIDVTNMQREGGVWYTATIHVRWLTDTPSTPNFTP